MRGKGLVAVGIGIASAVGISTILKDQQKRQQLMKLYNDSMAKVNNWFVNDQQQPKDLVLKAGNPDPYDTEDNKMVDEGAVFGVQYYNQEKLQQ